MAIAEIKKVQILGHGSKKEEVIEWLQRAGRVEICDLKEQASAPEYAGLFSVREAGEKVSGYEERTARLKDIEATIKLLSGLEEKRGLLESIIKTRPEISEGEMEETARRFDYQRVCREAASAEQKRKELHARKAHLTGELFNLHPWRRLDLTLDEAGDTRSTKVVLGKVPERDFGPLVEELTQSTKFFYLEVINSERRGKGVFVVFPRTEEEKILPCLHRYNFAVLRFPELREKKGDKRTVAGVIRTIEGELEELEQEQRRLEAEIYRMLPEKARLMAVYDWLLNQRAKEEVAGRFLRTDQTFVLAGWIKAEETGKLRREFSRRFPETEVIVSDSRPEENPPVILENKAAVQPFEVITGLYGLPHREEFDPTPLFAPFFALFFGLCLTDAGYGLILIILSCLGLRKIRAGKEFFRLLLMLGVFTTVLGALMGSWFGDFLDLLPSQMRFLSATKEKLMLLDPLEDSFLFMGIAVVLGLVQVLFGMGLKLVRRFRKGERIGAVFVQGAWMIFLLALVPLLGKTLFGLKLEGRLFVLNKLIVLAAALSILLFSGHPNRNVVKRLGIGLYGLYGIAEYFSHVLSYIRLFALGLATAVLALAVNAIMKSVIGTPIIGPVLGAVIFVAGHTFNLFINALSGFIHSVRLQFLEFFSKFFEGGGRAFRPFKKETKYVALKS